MSYNKGMLDETTLDRVLQRLHEEVLASLEAGNGGPFAAAVVKQGRVVATGTNTVLRDLDVSHHGEISALAAAGAALGSVDLAECELVTTHFPCLMCYHAIKWAGIRQGYFVFDYHETEELFGFLGDSRFFGDLGLKRLDGDPALRLDRIESAVVDSLFRTDLVDVWNNRYRDRLSAYDVS